MPGTTLDDVIDDDWDKFATTYKNLMRNGTTNRPAAAMIAGANSLLPFAKATAILDNGCGPGTIMAELLDAYGSSLSPACKLLCADFSDSMLSQVYSAREEVIASDPSSPWQRVETKVQDATSLSAISTSSQSHVMAGFVYMLTPNPRKCLTESHRVLIPGGVLACTSIEDTQWLHLMRLISQIRSDKKVPSMPEAWCSAEGVKCELEAAGFLQAETQRVEIEMPVATYDKLTNLLFSMPHMVQLTADMSEAEKAELRELMIAGAKEVCPELPGRLKGIAIIGLGKK